LIGKPAETTVRLGGKNVECLIDTGSVVSMISSTFFYFPSIDIKPIHIGYIGYSKCYWKPTAV
jgi:hypothetical protein